MEIHIYVKHTGVTDTVDVQPDDTVGTLRQRVAAQCPFPEQDTVLLLGGELGEPGEADRADALDSDMLEVKVSETGVEHGDVVNVIFSNRRTLRQVQAGAVALADLPQWALEDRDVVLEAVRHDSLAMEYLTTTGNTTAPRAHSDPCSSNTALHDLCARYLEDAELMLEAVQHSMPGVVLSACPPSLLGSEAFLSQCLHHYPDTLVHAAEGLLRDRDVMGRLIREHGARLLEFAHESLRDDAEFVRESLRAKTHDTAGATALQYAHRLAADKAFVMAALAEAEGEEAVVLQHAADSLRADREVVEAAISKDGSALQYASEALRDNEDVVIMAIHDNIFAIKHCSARLLSSEEFMTRALRLGCTLFCASDDLTSNEAFMLQAVGITGASLSYASTELRAAPDIVLAAVAENPHSLTHAAAGLKDDAVFMEQAVEVNGRALRYATNRVKACKAVAVAACKQDVNAYEYVSPALKGDADITAAARDQNPDAFKFMTGMAMRPPRRVFGN